MKRNFFLGTIVLFLACIAGLAFPGAVQAGEAVPTLRIFSWAEYFAPAVLEAFEAKHKCRIAVDYFDDDAAMFYKVKMSGGYDVLTPAAATATLLYGQNLIQKIDRALLPNIGNLDQGNARFTEDPDMLYCVPYTRVVSGVGYDRRKIDEADLGSWKIFANPAYARRMTMLADIRETIGVALKTLGFSVNTADQSEIDAAADLIISWKPNLANFATAEGKLGLASGEFLAAHVFNGDIVMMLEDNPDLAFYVPREGGTVANDVFAVCADSRQAGLAHAFINHMLDPAVAAENMEYIKYYMPNARALELISDELRRAPYFIVGEEDLERCEFLRSLGEDSWKYTSAWDRIRSR